MCEKQRGYSLLKGYRSTRWLIHILLTLKCLPFVNALVRNTHTESADATDGSSVSISSIRNGPYRIRRVRNCLYRIRSGKMIRVQIMKIIKFRRGRENRNDP